MEPESRIARRSLMFRCDAADIVSGTLGWSDAAGDAFRMSKHLIYIALLFIVVIAAAQTAIAKSISVELAEKTPPADPDDLIPPTTTTTITTTTTTTLPTISRCPDGIAGATAGSRSGYNYWRFDAQNICSDAAGNFGGGAASIYCFENPYVQQAGLQPSDWEMVTQELTAGVVLLLGINNTWYAKALEWFCPRAYRPSGKPSGDLLHLRLSPRTRLLRTRSEDHDG